MKTVCVAALSALLAMSASAQAPTRVKAEAAEKTAVATKPPAIALKETRDQPQPSKRLKAQQDAMKELAFLDGEWRGTSRVMRKDGWAPMVQTGRVGTMLDGTVLMIEAKGYEADGRLSFDVLRIISYEPETQSYSMRSYQSGRVRDHVLSLTDNGVAWDSDSGNGAIRYEASVKNGAWTETATRMPARGEPETYVEVKLKRQRSSSWPQAGGVGAK
jgi:hypothetical protein